MNKFLSSRDRPLVIAHRGASANYPENTMIAYETAIAEGADAIELDVRLSLDKRLVIMHNNSIAASTGGQGRVSRMTLRELQKYQTEDGKPILTLDEVFDKLAGKVGFSLDLKYAIGPRKVEIITAELVKKYNIADQVMFCGPFWAAKRIKKVIPNAVFCWSFIGGTKFISFLTRRHFDVWGIRVGKYSRLSYRSLLRKRVMIHGWVIDDASLQAKLISQHIEMITTNKPAQARKLVDSVPVVTS